MLNATKRLLSILLVAATACGAMAQSLSQVTVAPTSVEGGHRAILSVVLDSPAPRGGVTVTLTSSDTSVATVPASVTIYHRQIAADVVVHTETVATATPVTLTAALDASSMDATLTVGPLALAGVSVVPSTIAGGKTATGYVMLDGPAPSGGWVITLSGDNSAAATVPASVTVEQGRSEAHFSIPTSTVTADETVNITATDPNAVEQTTALTVVPLGLSKFKVFPDTVRGGQDAEVEVVLNEVAPSGGIVITLSSDDPSTTVPASVTIPEGSTRAYFQITTTAVTVSTDVTLTATDPAGASLTAALTVDPVKVVSLYIVPGSIRGGRTAQGYIELDGPAPTGGLVITLSSNNSAVTVPATATVAAGKYHVSFGLTTTTVASRTVATITATDPNDVAVTYRIVIR